jgi:hypothetical protein
MSSDKRDKWIHGNPQDGKHYWLSPSWLWERAARLLGVTKEQLFDPCPHPRPAGFDGLNSEWGDKTYLNPPFPRTEQLINGELKSVGVTPWVKKALQERDKGKDIVLVFPVDRWIHLLLKAGVETHSVGDVRWESTEDRSTISGSCRPIMAFILKGKKQTS